MCGTITKKLAKVTSKERVAWKCIAESSSKRRWYPICLTGNFPRGEWAKATHDIGFNCYLSEEDAKKAGWSTSDKPVKVRIRKVQGYGNFSGTKIVFAREIYVPIGR